MALQKMRKKGDEIGVIAKLLVKYWKSRGMKYNIKWAKNYLMFGHEKEIKKDEFFVYKENGKLVGVISLITDISNVAEIRDEVIFSNYKRKIHMKKMLKELIKIAKIRKLRKVYSLSMLENVNVYRSLGFKKEGILKNHFVSGENLAIMSMFLNQKGR